ncbi:MAG: ABC transporter permease [Acidobacteriaceae bacterium]
MLRSLIAGMRVLLHPAKRNAQIEDELKSFFESSVEDKMRRGMSAEDAGQAARIEIGSGEMVRQKVWSAGWESWADSLVRDLRFAARQLRKSPGFAAAVVTTLTLAIGVNTVVFSFLDGFLLRKLPYPESDRVAVLMEHELDRSNPARFGDEDRMDYLTWRAVKGIAPSAILAATGNPFGTTAGVNLQTGTSDGGAVQYVRDTTVSAHYFQVLGIEPMLGRGFTENEDRPGGGRAVILSYNLWWTMFHADSAVLGKAILLKGAPYTVVGVLPPGAQMPHPADVWTPLMPGDPNGVCGGTNCWILMRLKLGVSWNQLRTELAHTPLGDEIDPQKEDAWYYPTSLRTYTGSSMKDQTQALMAAVGFILLIACANLAGLMLARIHRRQPEMAARLALGATRARILRQLWIENLVLAVMGGSAGIGLALVLFPVLKGLLPPEMIPIGGLRMNGPVLAFSLDASVLTSLLFGALPALETRNVDLRSSIAAGTRTLAGGSGRVRQWLIGAEVTLTIMLLAGAGLMVRTIAHLESLPPGFDPHNVMTATASLDEARYHDAAAFQRLLRESVAAMERIPGVENAAVGLSVPYGNFENTGIKVLDGKEAGTENACSTAYTTPEYFAALRIPLIAGREFTNADTAKSQAVAIVNTAFGRRYFGTSRPLGMHFQSGRVYTIVGVVANTLDQSWVERDAPIGVDPIFYVSYAQVPGDDLAMTNLFAQPSWIVRTQGAVAGLTEQMQRALATVDPNLPFSGFYSMEDVLDQQLQTQRIEMALLGVLAGLALLLAAVGIYALVSNLVAQRTREIGIRIALGSTVAEAMRHVASSGILAAGGGVMAGLAGCFMVLRVMKSAIYGVGVYDPMTLTAAPLLLLTVAGLASLLSALRISRIDPATTLRSE